ncbi:MAG: NRDE family protein [Saprospiraceae bacterium]
MCTVVFIPENNKQLFASLRDESPLRPTAPTPEIYSANGTTVLAPKDAFAGGTWLGINDYSNIIILLNGGFEKHQREEHYKKSRGLIVSELLASEMPVVDWELLYLDAIEPFRLLVWSNQMLFHLVWDGNKKFRIKLDSTIPHILSSSTLYTVEAKENRQELFQKWMALNPTVSKLSLLNFFRSGDDYENGFIINRNEKVKTLSYSFIEFNNNNVAELNYYDLQNYSHSSKSIFMKTSAANCDMPIL